MSLEPIQQFSNILQNSRDVIIFVPENSTGDSIGCAWAFYYFLQKKNIKATIVIARDEAKLERFSFLVQPENIMHSLSGARDFVLSFNTKYNKIINVRTERGDEELRIFITPEHGSVDPRDFSFIPAKFKYDLAVVFDSPDKESIGKIYEENPDIFYEVPIVNIDHHGENENFGQINIVDITAGASAEVLADVLEKIDPQAVDETVAQCLLTGIIDATNSFQKKNTTPKSLQAAAMLMTKGADQQKIIRYLYKTQPFHLLKLWGRIMARLYWEEDIRMVWAPVLLEDFVQSRSNTKDMPYILEKIKENYSNGKIFMVLFEEAPGKMRCVITCADRELLKKIANGLGGSCSGDVCEIVETADEIQEAGKRVVGKIRMYGLLSGNNNGA